MKYISLFSGVGGLESATSHPVLCCEIDAVCWPILRRRFGKTLIHWDVRTLMPPPADVIVGGWPCQDISVAGLRRGLAGQRSGLFFEMLRVARDADAHTIVAENVPNILALERGGTFQLLLQALHLSGFRFVAWRRINVREFGLPHSRERIFIVASRHREVALALHRPYEHDPTEHPPSVPPCNGFYWTAGLQSICYSVGYIPTLKVGSGLSIPSPPAVYFDNCVRKATSRECLKLQGFDPSEFEGIREQEIFRMAGNAVALPVGRFVLSTVESGVTTQPPFAGFGSIAPDGFSDGDVAWVVQPRRYPLAANLHEYVDLSNRTGLSARAAAGLVGRLRRSGKPCPPNLLEILVRCAGGLLDSKSVEDSAGAGLEEDHGGDLDHRTEDGHQPDLFDEALPGKTG